MTTATDTKRQDVPRGVTVLARMTEHLLDQEGLRPGTLDKLIALADEANPFDMDVRITGVRKAAYDAPTRHVRVEGTRNTRPGSPEPTEPVTVHPKIAAAYCFAETADLLATRMNQADEDGAWDEAIAYGEALAQVLEDGPGPLMGDTRDPKGIRPRRLGRLAPDTVRRIHRAYRHAGIRCNEVRQHHRLDDALRRPAAPTPAEARIAAAALARRRGSPRLMGQPIMALANQLGDRDHEWHMEVLTAITDQQPILTRTPWRSVDVENEREATEAADWWRERTDAGSEGIVVKPWAFTAYAGRKLVSPAMKVPRAGVPTDHLWAGVHDREQPGPTEAPVGEDRTGHPGVRPRHPGPGDLRGPRAHRDRPAGRARRSRPRGRADRPPAVRDNNYLHQP